MSRHTPTDRPVLGLDLGGTKLRASVDPADATGDLVLPTAHSTASAFVDQIEEAATTLTDRTIGAICIAGAGVPDSSGHRFDQAPNLAAVQGADIVSAVQERFGVPVRLENDVNAAAIAEWHQGDGRTRRGALAYIAVGSGVGMGVVLDGELLRGTRGAAGEISHLPIGADPFDPQVRDIGALEYSVGGLSLGKRYSELTGHATTGNDVFDRAQAGEPVAIRLVEALHRSLAEAVLSVVATLDVDEVVLGGGIGTRDDVLAGTRGWLGLLHLGHIALRTSALGERGGVVGALRLADELLQQSTMTTMTSTKVSAS